MVQQARDGGSFGMALTGGLLTLCTLALLGCGPRTLGSFLPGESDASAEDPIMDGCELAGCEPDDGGAVDEGPEVRADAQTDASEGPVERPPECERPEDCDDQDACKGVYTCRAGLCEQVLPPCHNPDPAHCDAQCQTVRGMQVCDVVPRDADGDGHGDRLCIQAGRSGADDCDDTQAAIHTRAREVCDGVDNDCNGKVDVEDGLTLTGTNQQVAAGSQPRVASSGADTFGAVYEQGGGKVVFHSFKSNGENLLGSRLIVPLDSHSLNVVPDIAGGDDSFGMLWSRDGTVRFLEVDLYGVAVVPGLDNQQHLLNVNPEGVSAGRASATRMGSEDWLVMYASSDPAELAARAITHAAEFLEPVSVRAGSYAGAPSLVTTQHGMAAAWTRQEGVQTRVEWTPNLDFSGASDITVQVLDASTGLDNVSSAVLASGPAGYAVAWAETTNFAGARALRFALFAHDGAVRCEPFDVEVAEPEGRSALVPTAMVASDRGFLIAGFSVGTTTSVDLVEVSAGPACRYLQHVQVSAEGSQHVTMARAPSGQLLLLWDVPGRSTSSMIHKRALAPQLCEPASGEP